jgi:hypothetical protein
MSVAESLKSRKIVSFVVVVMGVLALVAVTTKMHTPENVSVQALWVVGACGFFTIGGQALVDAVSKWKIPGVTPSEQK